ncbi:MAG TPA: hypothetical protein VGM31_14170 [Puia sp.]|jgi:hypothetical protein
MNRQPHVGETVLYYPAKSFTSVPDPNNPFAKKVEDPDKDVKSNGNEDGPVAAIVTRQWGNGGPAIPLINLTILPDQGAPVYRASVAHASNKVADGQAHWTYLNE